MPFDLICHTERMNGVKKNRRIKELNENLNTHVATILDTKDQKFELNFLKMEV